MIIINLLDLFCFRTAMLIFLNFLFSLLTESFIIGSIFAVIHIFLSVNNFLYNHLFHFVPNFIDYPYDEFTSSFDIILLVIKLILSAAGTTKFQDLGNLCFLVYLYFRFFLLLFHI